MLKKVLIANRGEIAVRVIKTLKKLRINCVAVYSEADRFAPHVLSADESICLGEAQASKSYLCGDKIIEEAVKLGVDGIHPGYGFLSENPDFAEACEKAGIAFMGPTAQQMKAFGLKHAARALAKENNIPLLEGSPLLNSLEEALDTAESIGYPVMLKSTAGGGGIGMSVCRNSTELEGNYESVKRLGENNFSDSGVFLEKFVERARHIEVQIFGDGAGNVIALGERDCSTQRRNQKVIEETPAPHMPEDVRQELHSCACRLAAASNYRSAGTVEYVYDAIEDKFYFLEMNTRLQVEHGVTEEVMGLDLVEWMVRLAGGEDPQWMNQKYTPNGASIQTRVYAEDPGKNFQPSSGLLTSVTLSGECRNDHWISNGTDISPFYDPLLAKVIVHADCREAAIDKLKICLDETKIYGIECNVEYLKQIVKSDAFKAGEITTRYLNEFLYKPRTMEIQFAGTMTTVQDYPGRTGYWDVGVPPSGPMDSLSFRLANRVLGNSESAAGLECLISGPTIKFNLDTQICLSGAETDATLDGRSIEFWKAIHVQAGSVLKIGKIKGAGCRTYLAVAGGLDVPDYLGSKSTFTLGQFGGHGGRALMVGDVLKVNEPVEDQDPLDIPEELIPDIGKEWNIAVTYGPHGAPDFFTEEDIDHFLKTKWEVHFNSARTGVRLIGPKPKWARKDGGEAGLHPSNIHDNAYAIGAVDFTGDMPVILGPDGPSLGGFVCPVTVVNADLWKLGQLHPGDTIQFCVVTQDWARKDERNITQAIAGDDEASLASLDLSLESFAQKRPILCKDIKESPILDVIDEKGTFPEIVIRQAGDKYILIEFGPLVLDLNLRFLVNVIKTEIDKEKHPSILEMTPGIRSLQIHFDSQEITGRELVQFIKDLKSKLPPPEEIRIPNRIVYLPLSWDDPSTQLAIEKYMQGVRKDAPWCPSNIEFIRRINGLETIDDVKKIVYSASYLVMGLGDVYLGAPVATPLDPRHRLVTTKYNPARTWTPENAVGIGGAYMCVYGMEGPGGYQFVGRTIQMWNRHRKTEYFKDGKPWLLRFFDEIRFYEVSESDLKQAREEFLYGKYPIKIEESSFSLSEYNDFLATESDSIEAFRSTQRKAFAEERQRWEENGLLTFDEEEAVLSDEDADIPEGCEAISSSVPGSVWKLEIKQGESVSEGQVIAILESMKMEISIISHCDGKVESVLIEEGQTIQQGQNLFIVKPG